MLGNMRYGPTYQKCHNIVCPKWKNRQSLFWNAPKIIKWVVSRILRFYLEEHIATPFLFTAVHFYSAVLKYWDFQFFCLVENGRSHSCSIFSGDISKPFVSTEIPSPRELASHFAQVFFYRRNTPNTIAKTESSREFQLNEPSNGHCWSPATN